VHLSIGFLTRQQHNGNRSLGTSLSKIAMPLDHYISQVYLKKFYSPALGNHMYAIRKIDLKAFTPRSEDVCRIMDGSTNAYLREDRAIEDFLKSIEPNYNAALGKLIAGKIDNECIYTIAGLIAYVVCCSPTGMRIHSSPLKSSVEVTATMIDAQGLIPPAPAVLGGARLSELLRDGAVKVTIDPKYPQAIGINLILKITATFGNFKWEILRNDFDDTPFFTSDFPVAIEKTNDPRNLNRIVPLAPNLALRIVPDLRLDRDRSNFSFANFSSCSLKLRHNDVVKLNSSIVRCAEETVFYRDDLPWVRPFVAKNRHYRIEPQTRRLTTPTGALLIFTQAVVASDRSVELRRLEES
jgi:hypothetical protein